MCVMETKPHKDQGLTDLDNRESDQENEGL